MSSPAPSQSDDGGDDIRMHGDPNEHDSSEEEEDDEEEAARIRAGFIVDEDDEDEDENMDSEETRRKRRKHKKRKRGQSRGYMLDMKEEPMELNVTHPAAQVDLDADDLELLMENTGARRPLDDGSDRKRHKRRDSSDSRDGRPTLDDMFNEPSTSRNDRMDDGEEDDMDDFIEEDEDEEMDEDARAEMRRQKKEAKRANAKKVRSYAGADQQ